MFNSLKSKVITAGAIASLIVTNASAALTAPTISTGDFETVAGVLLVAGGVMWAIRKALRLANV